jgi:putative phosphoesterase
MKIGLLSDTHSYLDDQIFHYLKEVDEIWHAGDIGNIEIFDRLNAFKPTIAVYGNIDGATVRTLPEHQCIEREGFKILLLHIGGQPNKYNTQSRALIQQYQPNIFVCGHSHMVRVVSDEKYKGMLHLNPGACGREGFHQMRTLLRFELNEGQIKNMQLIELGPRSMKA